MAIQELNQVEINSVSGGFTNYLTALPIVGPILNHLLNGVGPAIGGELLTNPLGVVTATISNGVTIVSGVLSGVLAIVTGLLRP